MACMAYGIFGPVSLTREEANYGLQPDKPYRGQAAFQAYIPPEASKRNARQEHNQAYIPKKQVSPMTCRIRIRLTTARSK